MELDWFKAAEAAWQGKRLAGFEVPADMSVADIRRKVREAALKHIAQDESVTVLALLSTFSLFYACILAHQTAPTIAGWRKS